MTQAGRSFCLLACALLVRAAVARADDSSGWEFSRPAGKIDESFQLYTQRIQGLQDDQLRLDGELELALTNGPYGFKLVPWGWLRIPDAQGGNPQQARPYGDLK